MSKVTSMRPNHYRAIFISDVHLGFRGCQAEYLLDFLRSTTCSYLYLVGDIVDVWNMKRGIYWPQAHNNVVRSILGKAKHDTKVIYVPGNHDEVFRDHEGLVFGNVMVKLDDVHTTADGRRLLILHGDEFDSVVKCAGYLAVLGNYAYDWLLALNRHFNSLRRYLGLRYWSLAAYLKHKVKNAVNYISGFEEAVTREVNKRKVDGLVCGHIHHATIKKINRLDYLNCGDWVESCTALVEHFDGTIELINWIDQMELKKQQREDGDEPSAEVVTQ